VLNEKLWPSSV